MSKLKDSVVTGNLAVSGNVTATNITSMQNNIDELNSNLGNKFKSGLVEFGTTLQVPNVNDSWSTAFLVVTGREGYMGTLSLRDWSGITTIVSNKDVNVYMSGGYLYIQNNGGATLQYTVIKCD